MGSRQSTQTSDVPTSATKQRSSTELMETEETGRDADEEPSTPAARRLLKPPVKKKRASVEHIRLPRVRIGRFLEGLERGLRGMFLCSWLLFFYLIAASFFPQLAPPDRLVQVAWPLSVSICSFQLFLYSLVVCLASWDRAHATNAFGHAYVIFGPQYWAKPNLAGLPHARHASVPTRDGETLGAWHVLPGGRIAREAAMRVASGASIDDIYDEKLKQAENLCGARAILYLHGMGESRCKWVVVEHLKFISTLLGLHVLAIDYRGFADSTGSPTEAGLCTDAEAGVQWLCDHGDFRPDEVLCWAHSLGTGVAVRLAHSQQSSGQPLRGIILEAPYLSVRQASMQHPAALPFRALPFGRHLVYTWQRGGDELNTKLRIGELELPILLLHGKDDIMVPCEHSQILDSLLKARAEAPPASATREGTSQDELPSSRRFAPHFFVPLPATGHLDAIFQEATLPSIVDFLGASDPGFGVSSPELDFTRPRSRSGSRSGGAELATRLESAGNDESQETRPRSAKSL